MEQRLKMIKLLSHSRKTNNVWNSSGLHEYGFILLYLHVPFTKSFDFWMIRLQCLNAFVNNRASNCIYLTIKLFSLCDEKCKLHMSRGTLQCKISYGRERSSWQLRSLPAERTHTRQDHLRREENKRTSDKVSFVSDHTHTNCSVFNVCSSSLSEAYS